MRVFFLKIAFLCITCAMFLAFAQALERPAYGYVDPGSGLLLLQSAGSAVMAALFVCRRKIARLLRLSSSSEDSTSERNDK